jgi:NADPH:quinone reductase-like Zn-dependent oxidoreductase
MAAITKMRIHRFGDKEVLQADDIEPSQPDAGPVLVKVHAASINPVDFKIRSGKYPAVKDDRLPYSLGRDFSGVVEKCGARLPSSSRGTKCSEW